MTWAGIATAASTLGALLAGCATVALVIVGYIQVRAIRKQIEDTSKENKLERTLAACSRYESDITIERCAKVLRQARDSGALKAGPKRYRHEAVIVLNYLDTLAIGIEQNLYEESLAQDHMKAIVRHYCNEYLTKDEASALEIDRNDFSCLLKLAGQWTKPETKFKTK